METTCLNEPVLAARALTEPEAFALLYDAYFPRIYNYIRFRVQDPHLTDDLTSQVFERLLKKISYFQPGRGSFAAWLFAIAHNVVVDHYRAEQRQRWAVVAVAAESNSIAPDPLEALIDRQRRQDVLQALAALTGREREVIALKFSAGLTNREIAKLTGFSASHIGVMLFRALKQLKKRLEQEAGHHE